MEGAAKRAWSRARPGRSAGHEAACVAPLVSMEIDPSGWVYACCANQLYPLGRIGRDRLTDLWGGPRAQVLRDALARWDLSVGCGACQWHLEHGRMDPDAAVYDRYPVAGAAPDGPVAMTFALSNRCNLACSMCTPELSSTLRHKAGLAPLPSPFDDGFFEDLERFLPGLRYAKFLGGEPFLIPQHHRVWDLMDRVGGPPRMQVTTNGTVWNDRVAWLLDRFPFDVTVSVDGTSRATYEAIRAGASFDELVTNLERFRAACRRSGTELRICFCLMEQNAHELADMVRWSGSLGAALSINVVTEVDLSLHDLPLDRLERVRQLWEEQAAGTALGPNERVWHAQVAQLDAVIADRRRGLPPPARQPLPPGSDWFEAPSAAGSRQVRAARDELAEALEVERAHLAAWSGGGSVADLRCSPDGTIVSVRAEHERLGLDRGLEGQPVMCLVDVVASADGRSPWMLGVDRPGGDRTVRTVLLSSAEPRRGSSGAVVRIVSLPTPDGFATLVAEDRIYDTQVAVAIGRPAGGS